MGGEEDKDARNGSDDDCCACACGRTTSTCVRNKNSSIQRLLHKATSTEFKAGKIVRPISKAKGRGQTGARNLTHASIPEMAKTNPIHNVDRMIHALDKERTL